MSNRDIGAILLLVITNVAQYAGVSIPNKVERDEAVSQSHLLGEAYAEVEAMRDKYQRLADKRDESRDRWRERAKACEEGELL
jgi:hypothetical protein